MYNTHLSSMSVERIDSLFKKHPYFRMIANLSSDDTRISIYNKAQEDIHYLYNMGEEFIFPIGISGDGKVITYFPTTEGEVMYEITTKDIEYQRNSVLTAKNIDDSLALQLKDYTIDERTVLYDLAAQAVGNTHNKIGDNYYEFVTLGTRSIENELNTYSDIYPICIVRSPEEKSFESYNDIYPVLNILSVIEKSQSSYCDLYPVLTAGGGLIGTTELESYNDIYAVLTVAGGDLGDTVKETYSDIYPVLTTSVIIEETLQSYNDIYPILTAYTLVEETLMSYCDLYPILTVA
jgi:hypothetical protein